MEIIRFLICRGWPSPEKFSGKAARSQPAFHFRLGSLFAFEDCDSFAHLQKHLSLENNCTENQGANAFLIILQEGVIYKHLHMNWYK